MQHLAAASSRAHYLRRRERQRSSGLGPSEVLIFTSSSSTSRQTNETSPEDCQILSYGSPEGDSPTSGVNVQIPSSVDVNLGSTTSVNQDIPFRPRYYKRLFNTFVFINCTSCGILWFLSILNLFLIISFTVTN